MKKRVQIGRFYINPELGLIEKHFMLMFTAYYDINDEASYLAVNFGFLNISFALTLGVVHI